MRAIATNLTDMGVFINLTPFIPLSLKGEGEEILERGFSPPL